MPADENHEALPKQGHATLQVYFYILVVSLLLIIPSNVLYTPLQTIYKDQLHLNAKDTANFKLLVSIPSIFAFIFGYFRDRFNPLRIGDRGFFLIFGAISSVIVLWVAHAPLTKLSLGMGLTGLSVATSMIGAAFQALMRNIADVRMMTGRMSTLYNGMLSVIGAIGLYSGGWLTAHTDWRGQLTIGAILYLLIALIAFWNPKDVLEGVRHAGALEPKELLRQVRELTKFRAYWIAVVIWGLWSFTPASGTPMYFYITDTLKMTSEQYGTYAAILTISFIPTTLLFGPLCKKFRFRGLLLVSTLIAIPQWLPALFLHNESQVNALAVFVGLTGGLATVAYYDLLFRACPKGLAGSGMLLGTGLALLFIEGGNVAGGYIYKAYGFLGCSIVTTAAYGLLLPLCLILPRALVNPKDDERVPGEQELVAAS